MNFSEQLNVRYNVLVVLYIFFDGRMDMTYSE